MREGVAAYALGALFDFHLIRAPRALSRKTLDTHAPKHRRVGGGAPPPPNPQNLPNASRFLNAGRRHAANHLDLEYFRAL